MRERERERERERDRQIDKNKNLITKTGLEYISQIDTEHARVRDR